MFLKSEHKKWNEYERTDKAERGSWHVLFELMRLSKAAVIETTVVGLCLVHTQTSTPLGSTET